MQNKQRKKNINLSDHKRAVLVACTLFFLFSVLIYQFFNIQILENEKWEKTARRQHFFVVREPFVRGSFWSNSAIKVGHPEKEQRLVFDIQKFHLYIDPLSIPEEFRDQIADFLIKKLKLKDEEAKRLRYQFNLASRSRKLVTWLDQATKDEILQWWAPVSKKGKIARNALYFVADNRRSYPFGKLLGQALHTVQNQRDEVSRQALPTGGLELYFNKFLQGKEGLRVLKRSPRHAFETGDVTQEPEDGADVYLTVNHYLQAIAEEEVRIGVKKCRAKCGWAVMMDPFTGHILAMAQYPFFNPTEYPKYFNNQDLLENTRSKAITDAHEPGSTMKPITAAIVLLANQELIKRGEAPIFSPEEKISTADGKFPGRSQPIHDTRTHHYLNLNMAMQKSSNIYFGRLVEKMIERLGNQWYRDALQNVFGFGVKTDIELPSESAGLVPRIGVTHPNGALEWSTPTPFSLAMGHNMQANTIQMLRAFAVIANGGRLVRPTLVKKVTKGSDVLLDREKDSESYLLVIDKKISERVVEAIKFVTKPGGTGRRADVWGFTEAGKTGTTNKIVNGAYSKKSYVSSFIGFTPANNPRFVMIVVMDEPECRYIPGVGYNQHGSVCAAPVFKQIAKRSLDYLGEPPDDPAGFPYGDPRYDSKLADWVTETHQLQEMYEKWNMVE